MKKKLIFSGLLIFAILFSIIPIADIAADESNIRADITRDMGGGDAYNSYSASDNAMLLATPASGTGTIYYSSDQYDQYKIAVLTGEKVTITFTPPTGATSIDIAIYDYNKALITTVYNIRTTWSGTYTASGNGYIYFVIDADATADRGTYSLSVTKTATGSNVLTSGVPVTGTLSAVGQTEMWTIAVAANALSMESILTCGSADFDLYGRLGAAPTTSTYDWRGYTSGGEEVTYNEPGAGTWYIMVRDYSGSSSYELTVTISYSSGDTTPPTVTINSPTNGATITSSSVTASWSGSDNVGISYYETRIDTGTWINKGTTTTHSYTGLADGSHSIDVRAWDAAGNSATDTNSFTVDTSSSNVLTSGVPVTGTLSAVGQTEMWTIAVAANALSMESILTCGSADFDLYGRLGAAPTTSTYDWRGYTSGGEEVTYNEPGAGTWYIMVRDYSGSGSYELTVTITYTGPDTTPPTITIGNPAQGSTVYSSDISVSWTGSDNVGISYYEIQLDSASWINKGTQTSHAYTGVTAGAHSISVRAWDAAGNSATDTNSFTVDLSSNPVEYYAVLVGISDYLSISDLSYCDEDASDWYNHLVSNLGWSSSNIRIYGDGHTSNYPTYYADAYESNVVAGLNWMIGAADSNDVIAFISSGHGSGTGTGSSYLCMYDCSGSQGCLYDTELANILDGAIAEKIFVFLDHCYSGGFGPELMNMPNSANVYLTTTCTEDGYGYDASQYNNGMWTYYFLEYSWINHYGGSATISLEAIFSYAAASYPYGGGDTPQQFDGNTGASFYLN